MTVPTELNGPIKDEYRPPSWNGHRTFLSIEEEEASHRIGAFTLSDGNELAPPEARFHAWVLPLLWCTIFSAGCQSLMGPYIPFLAYETFSLELPEMSIVFAINRGATAIGALLAYCVINASNGAAMLKSATFLAGVSFAAYGGLFYIHDTYQTQFMGAAGALYGMAGFCYSFFLVFTLTILFYHYAKKFRLYICLFEFMTGLGGTYCIVAAYYVFEQMKALPFFIMGGCLAFGSLFACTVSPDRGIPTKRSTVTSRNGCHLLCDIPLLIDVLTMACAWISFAYLEVILYRDVRKLEGAMDLFRTTYLFATYYGFYAVGILVFGTIGLMWRTESFSAIIAQICATAGFVIGTPILKEVLGYSITDLPEARMLKMISVGLIGFAAAGQVIPMMRKLMRDCIERGFARTIWTMSTLSTTIVFLCSALACGACLMTGFVYNLYGEETLAYCMVGIHGSWLIVRILSFLVSCFCCKHRDENLEEYEG